MEVKKVQFQYTLYKREELNNEENILIESALKAAESAYAPYSNFKVGAAVRLDDDTIITGNNQENAAYPSGLCAERVALFYAHAQKPEQKIKALAIVALNKGEITPSPAAPCGACRQVLAETAFRFGDFPVYLIGKDTILKIDETNSLLPLTFNADDLQ